MENTEWGNVWKKIDSVIPNKSDKELEQLLRVKTRKTIRKFLLVYGIAILVSAGFLLFLFFTAKNRPEDLPYQINNLVLGMISLVSLVSGIVAWYKLQKYPGRQSLKSWLNEKIRLLNSWTEGKKRWTFIVLIPVIYLLTFLSIHIYFEEKLLLDVLALRDEESASGLFAGLAVGLIASLYAAKKMRAFRAKNLAYLKSLFNQLVGEA